MADKQMYLPGFSGLQRFNEEYNSKLKISPGQVIVLVAAVILFVLSLKWFFPVKVAASFLGIL
jgi:preprotein translocase subunit Sec61beta